MQCFSGNECSPFHRNHIPMTTKPSVWAIRRRLSPLSSHHIESLLQSASMRTPRCTKIEPFYVLVGPTGETLNKLLTATLAFHHGAKSVGIGQSSGKRQVCMKSTFSARFRRVAPMGGCLCKK
jgi:hypothetical protein